MALEKTLASGKRFGARYGRSTRHKFSKIEAEQKKAHKCPYCHEPKVKRLAAGIWTCRKCKAKFTGRAYTIPKKVIIREEAAKKEVIELKEKEAEKEKKEPEEEKPKKYKEKKKTKESEEKGKEEAKKETEG